MESWAQLLLDRTDTDLGTAKITSLYASSAVGTFTGSGDVKVSDNVKSK